MDTLRSNPLLRELHASRRLELVAEFSVLSTAKDLTFLTLGKYLDACPERFFSKDVYRSYIRDLQHLYLSRKEELLLVLMDHRTLLDNAFRHTDEICGEQWHDLSILTDDEYGRLIFIDQELHPAYLRLIEAVLGPLLYIPAHFSRVDRKKSTSGLDLYNIVQELRTKDYEHILRPYDHLMRNAIAHGGISYSSNHIQYEDKKGNRKQFDSFSIIKRFDDLLDVCNGLLLALSLFLLTRDDPRYELPEHLLVDELRVATRTPYWRILGCLPMSYNNGSQLVIHVRPDTLDDRKVHFSLFHSAIMVEELAPGYDRYFFSFRSTNCWPGYAAFDGRKLAKLRATQSAIEEYGEALEDNLVFFVPRFRLPRLLAILESLWLSFKIHTPLIAGDIRQKLGLPTLTVRSSKMHRNGWASVLEARVVIGREVRTVDPDVVRRNCVRIFRKGVFHGRSQQSVANICKYLPVGFCKIFVYRQDYRVRRLITFGLEKDLVCTIEVKRLKRIKSPDILGSTVEIRGRYRIAWNRSWLESLVDWPEKSDNL